MASTNNPGLGNEFEVLLPAYLALKFIKNDEIRDFQLRSNVKGFDKFDDVLIDIKMENGGPHHFAIQLKHKERKDGKLLPSSFDTGTDFNLEKYCKAYHKLASDEYECLIFTNASFDSKKMKDVKKYKMALSKNDLVSNLLNSHIGNENVYKFEINEETDNKEKLEKFFQHFFLFVAQKNTKELEEDIKNIFETEYSATDVKISTEYVNLFRKWHKRQFTNDTLDRKTLSIHLVDLLLGNFVKKSTNGKINRNEKLRLLEESIRAFDVTIVEDSELKLITELGKCGQENCLPEVHKSILKLAKKYKLTDKFQEELKIQDKMKIFNYLLEKPFIIGFNEDSKDKIFKVLDMDFKGDINIKFVLVGKDIDQLEFRNVKTFKTLQDLSSCNNSLYQRMINEIGISLQGREKIKLEKLVKSHPEIEKIIQVKHLCQEDLKVGKELKLPEYYIPREVSVVVLDEVNILEDLIKKNHLLVINYGTEKQYLERIAKAGSIELIDIDEFIKDDRNLKNMKNEEKYVVVVKEMCIKDKFDKIYNMTHKKVCFLKINKKRKFILIKGKSDEIKGTYLKETQTLINFCDGINVLCAEPGMGKTSSMKNFTNQCPSDQWPVFLELRQFSSLFKENILQSSEILERLLCKDNEDKMTKDMRNIFIEKTKILLFLDGLDELDNKCIDNVLAFVKGLQKDGFNIWLSCRSNLKSKIEKELNLFSIDINQVNQEQQSEYINSRLKSHNYSEDQINQIINKIFGSINIQNNSNLLGIPLQLFMVTQTFIDDKDNYSKLSENQFILTKLYSNYFKGKIKHTLQKDGNLNESILRRIVELTLEQYEISALRSCLSDDDFKKLNLNEKKLKRDEEVINDIKRDGDVYGIIRNINEDKTVAFIHHTHAEYFAANYLSENFDKVQILGERFLTQKYDNLRLLFDIKLAENSPLHLSVLYDNLDQFNEHIENRDNINFRDNGGRTALHLVCHYGTKYSPLEYKKEGNSFCYDVPSNFKKEKESIKTMTDKLVKLYPSLTEDEIFKWNEIQHAAKCWCLYPLEAILKEQNLNPFSIYKNKSSFPNGNIFKRNSLIEDMEKLLNNNDKGAMAYYAAKFGYQDLMKVLLVDSDIMIKKMKYSNAYKYNFSYHTLLHIACVEGHKEIALLLIENNAKVNSADEYGYTPLHWACRNGDKEIALLLIENNANVNSADEYGYTPLHWACRNGDKEIALLLIENNANVSCVNESGETPLHMASWNGYKEIAVLLIENNAKVNSADEYGYIPLHGACRNGHKEIALLLIQNNANVNSVSNYGDTPLHWACLNGHKETAVLLIQNNANVNSVNKSGDTPLHKACSNGHTETALLLIQNNANVNSVNKSGDTPLHCTCVNGDKEIALLLIQNNTNVNSVNKSGDTPLHYTCMNGDKEIALLLIQNNANVNSVNKSGDTPLHKACSNGHTETALLLIQNNANVNSVNKSGDTPLHCTCMNGDKEIALLLIQNNTNVNSVNKSGDTPLHYTCMNGDKEIALLLIQNNANVNSVNKSGDTPLHKACSNGHTETALLLIQNNANVNSVNKSGDTPLHCTCMNGDKEIALLLIQNNTNVNSVNKSGDTPLHCTCMNGHEKITLLLIQNNANVNSVNKSGDTPLHKACSNGHTETALLLIQNNANVNSVNRSGCTPLHLACRNGHKEIALLLIQNNTNVNSVNKSGDTPLHYTCMNGDKEIALLLIQNNANVNSVNKSGDTPLHKACSNGHTETALLLIQNNANVNSVNKSGDTPLHCTCMNGDKEIALLLIQNNTNVNSVNKSGDTPLHYTCMNGDKEIALLLIQNNANVNSVNKSGDTPLHCTCMNGHEKITLLLIQNNANVNSVNKSGDTPLHKACSNGHTETALLLIQNNANVNSVNRSGCTPLHLACRNGHNETALLLTENNANVSSVNKSGITPLQ